MADHGAEHHQDGTSPPPGNQGDGNNSSQEDQEPSVSVNELQGRVLRSAKVLPEGDVFAMMEGLKLSDIENQPKGVGLVYDDMMAEPHCLWDEGYPENGKRVTLPWQRCQELGLVDRCVRIPARKATNEEIISQHHADLMNIIDQTATADTEQLKEASSKFDNVFFHPKTSEAARLAVGSTVDLMKQVVEGKVRNGMAIIRPPGHHATHTEACGYCFYNNVAIAAKHAVENMGLERVLIVDWDVHHGQASQYMFYDDPRVMYFSIHRYEFGTFWPNLRESDYDHIGDGPGKGYNINIPLNKIGMGNADFLAIFQQVLLPLAYEFNPQLILVSSGYDAALGCPEGEMEVTPACYAHFINLLKPLAEGKLCVVLEGGYCLESLTEGVALTLRALLDDPSPHIGSVGSPCDSMVSTILHVQDALSPHWKCFAFSRGAEIWEDNEEKPQNVVFATPETRPEKFDIYGDYHLYAKDNKDQVIAMIEQLKREVDLSKPPNRTCLVYDERMMRHKRRNNRDHPERPERIKRIYEKHKMLGLVERCKVIEPRMVTDEELLLVHGQSYLEYAKSWSGQGDEELSVMERDMDSIYLSEHAYEAASLACGCTLSVVDDVLSGNSQNGVAIVRPPGHHAERHTARGFCFFNSVAVAAKYAQKKYGLKRVMILDWDIHHGNGTQHMFEEDKSVLYVSLHRYDGGFFYPCHSDADLDKVGQGQGEGFNVNIPWSGRVPMGNDEYIAAFHHVVMPIAYEYDPELVLVSAGFDAAQGDPLGRYNITPEGYAHMTQMLLGLANGKLILSLEGGYNLRSISESMALCTSILLGDRCPVMDPLCCNRYGVDCIKTVLDTQKKYWSCLKFRARLFKEESELGTEEEEGPLLKEVQFAPVFPQTELLPGSHGDRVLDTMTSEMEDLSMTAAIGGDTAAASEPAAAAASIPDEELGACGGVSPGTTVAELLGANMAGQDLDSLQMFAVVPLSWCPHLMENVMPMPSGGIDTNQPCEECGNIGENWLCLYCYEVHCGRYVNEHMLYHGIETDHKLVLSYADLSVWCYGCDQYVHNEMIIPVKQAAHFSKFGEEMPGVFPH